MGQIKNIVRILFACMLFAAFVCYIIEFVRDQRCPYHRYRRHVVDNDIVNVDVHSDDDIIGDNKLPTMMYDKSVKSSFSKSDHHHFFCSYHSGHVGFIFLFIFIVIIILVGAFACLLENFPSAAIFVICFLVLVIVDAIYIGHKYAIVCGTMALAFGGVFAVLLFDRKGK